MKIKDSYRIKKKIKEDRVGCYSEFHTLRQASDVIYYSEKYTTFSPSSTSVLQATSVLVQVDNPGHLGTRDNSSSICYSQAHILELTFHNKAQKLSNKWASNYEISWVLPTQSDKARYLNGLFFHLNFPKDNYIFEVQTLIDVNGVFFIYILILIQKAPS